MDMFNIIDFSNIKNLYQNHGYQKGLLGCSLSHYNMWTLIAQDRECNANDFYLILEDDITYTDNFINKFNKILNILKNDKDWDVTYLGFTDYFDTYKQDISVHENIIKLGGGKRIRGGGTFSYFFG